MPDMQTRVRWDRMIPFAANAAAWLAIAVLVIVFR